MTTQPSHYLVPQDDLARMYGALARADAALSELRTRLDDALRDRKFDPNEEAAKAAAAIAYSEVGTR